MPRADNSAFQARLHRFIRFKVVVACSSWIGCHFRPKKEDVVEDHDRIVKEFVQGIIRQQPPLKTRFLQRTRFRTHSRFDTRQNKVQGRSTPGAQHRSLLLLGSLALTGLSPLRAFAVRSRTATTTHLGVRPIHAVRTVALVLRTSASSSRRTACTAVVLTGTVLSHIFDPCNVGMGS